MYIICTYINFKFYMCIYNKYYRAAAAADLLYSEKPWGWFTFTLNCKLTCWQAGKNRNVSVSCQVAGLLMFDRWISLWPTLCGHG